MGAKLDIRIEWFKQFWMSMLPLSLKPSLDSIWRRDGKRWSLKDIKMATMVVILIFQWNRYSIYECPWCPRLIQVHYISTFNPPAFPHFSLLRFPKVDFMSGKKPNLETTSPKCCWWGLKTTIIQLWCGHGFRHKVRKIDRWMSRGQLVRKANTTRHVFKKSILCTLGRPLK